VVIGQTLGIRLCVSRSAIIRLSVHSTSLPRTLLFMVLSTQNSSFGGNQWRLLPKVRRPSVMLMKTFCISMGNPTSLYQIIQCQRGALVWWFEVGESISLSVFSSCLHCSTRAFGSSSLMHPASCVKASGAKMIVRSYYAWPEPPPPCLGFKGRFHDCEPSAVLLTSMLVLYSRCDHGGANQAWRDLYLGKCELFRP